MDPRLVRYVEVNSEVPEQLPRLAGVVLLGQGRMVRGVEVDQVVILVVRGEMFAM